MWTSEKVQVSPFRSAAMVVKEARLLVAIRWPCWRCLASLRVSACLDVTGDVGGQGVASSTPESSQGYGRIQGAQQSDGHEGHVEPLAAELKARLAKLKTGEKFFTRTSLCKENKIVHAETP